jgi:hypothetical protein
MVIQYLVEFSRKLKQYFIVEEASFADDFKLVEMTLFCKYSTVRILRMDHGSLLRSKFFWNELSEIIVAFSRGPSEGS